MSVDSLTCRFQQQTTILQWIGNFLVGSTLTLDTLFWLDFTDPEVSQFFENRVSTGYPFAINGFSNHSDFQDMQFNFNQGWIFRKSLQMFQIPVFKQYQDMDMNFIYVYKHKMRKVNHWASSGEWLMIMNYGYFNNFAAQTGWNSRTRVFLRKYDYGSPVRVYQEFPGQGGWDICSYTITPANELGESVETSFTVHILQTPYFRSASEYRYSCSLSQVQGTRSYTTGNGNL